MGYTTDFNGVFKLNKKLDAETHAFLTKFNETRRMARNVQGYGIEGEFYVDANGHAGQEHTPDIIDYNRPPKTQPGLWCKWIPTHDGMGIEWDGGEKFYDYVTWIEYIIKNFLAPKGYKLTGLMQWRGEDFNDMGTIAIKNNVVTCHSGKMLSRIPGKARAKAKR